jgi:Flp pilus assembly pilin Flp
MNRLTHALLSSNVWNDKRGTELVEFALVGGLVAVVAVGALTSIGSKLAERFSAILAGLGG